MTSLELKILKLAQGWAKAKNPAPKINIGQGRTQTFFTAEYWEWKHRKAVARKLLKLFPASLKG